MTKLATHQALDARVIAVFVVLKEVEAVQEVEVHAASCLNGQLFAAIFQDVVDHHDGGEDAAPVPRSGVAQAVVEVPHDHPAVGGIVG
eukprot:CAMPEP_0179319736 /NCGR_PEP_ID=MMETSP0797-20121207/57645_1 /TAXON_ID=47934 /ORGANISM="Dinophysis acuminata, Strain DAEP01" /LENGTH=87 /DNA_ID=CAMNT_0021031129 /DNA_START=424 /DNA_END=688 /DNA_ORIENTATION=+